MWRASREKKADQPAKKLRKKRHILRKVVISLAIIVVVFVVCVRPFLPMAVRWYVNKSLSHNREYAGKIGDVSLSLWRGAYTIENVKLLKKSGNVPDPLFSAPKIELSIQWRALLHHKLVGQVSMDHPVVNFVDASEDNASQDGSGTKWLQVIENLFPFQINRVDINDGSIHFRSYLKSKPVDVYLSQLNASVDDLTNVENTAMPLLTTVNAKGLAMDQARFEFHMKLNPFSYRPTFKMAARLMGLDLTTINDLARTYGQFEFEGGFMDLVVEATAQEGELDGNVKPLFRSLKVFDLLDDLKNDSNPLQYFWQALLGVTTTILKNQPRDQFGTLIPFTGDLDSPDEDILATVGNVLRNAFVRAYLPRFENGTQSYDDMKFEAGSITGPDSLGASP